MGFNGDAAHWFRQPAIGGATLIRRTKWDYKQVRAMAGSIQNYCKYIFHRYKFTRLRDGNTRQSVQLLTRYHLKSMTRSTIGNGWKTLGRVCTLYLVVPGRLWKYARPRFPPKQFKEMDLNHFPAECSGRNGRMAPTNGWSCLYMGLYAFVSRGWAGTCDLIFK